MAVTLVVNPGSSSKKYALYRDGSVVFLSRFERTPLGFEQCTELGTTRQKCEGVSANDFGESIHRCLESAIAVGTLTDIADIETVIVRMVVPGTTFTRHGRIDSLYIQRLKEFEHTAPLHIPHTLREIVAVKKVLPQATLLAASDSAFHATMLPSARTYSIDPTLAAELDIYRFGYHGLSVASVVRRHPAVVGCDPTRAVVCHLGSGVSVTAVHQGHSVDTSMGYAPGTGLPMASRSGDLDTGALLSIMRARAWRPLDAEVFLSGQGGLRALAGTPDLRLVIEAVSRGERGALEAFDHYVYHIAKAIAAATVALGGMDSLIFTATAGERSSFLRAAISERVAFLGLTIDKDKNENAHSVDAVISTREGAVKVAVIRTDEMGEMALIAQQFLRSQNRG